jgi:hypothetical protein
MWLRIVPSGGFGVRGVEPWRSAATLSVDVRYPLRCKLNMPRFLVPYFCPPVRLL